jgi:SAM-dependent MidA family methyltransferase
MTLPDLIRAEIAHRGPIPFRDFMERALYHPEHGYYTSRARIGREGDFFTSVSVGPLFGALLARQFAEMWERLERPEVFTIVEQGAHRGDFAADVLAHLREHAPAFHACVKYAIVEPSPRARETQRNALDTFAEKTKWFASLDELPRFTGVHFCNELLDAFPIHLVKRTGSGWLERHVDFRKGAFVFVDLPLSNPALGAPLARLPEVPDGYVTEINLAALDLIEALSTKLDLGYVLAIDYGFPRDEYYRPERTDGTLSAYAAHRREPNPLARPGEIDLTAHVDFTTLVERALTLGFDLDGFTDQHHFVVGLSRLHFEDAPPTTPAAQKELRELQTLMHPNLMGRGFKALGLSKKVAPTDLLAGFQFGGDARAALGLR